MLYKKNKKLRLQIIVKIYTQNPNKSKTIKRATKANTYTKTTALTVCCSCWVVCEFVSEVVVSKLIST